MEPRLIVCDEPTSALDVSVQAQILNLLEDMKARYGLTMVFVAHDLAVVKNVSDRVAVMYLGKLCEVGPPQAAGQRQVQCHALADLRLARGHRFSEFFLEPMFYGQLALDKLKQMKRQASVLALRFVTDEYWAPLGVWVVREATRNAMKSRPIEFASRELMLKYAEAFVKKKFGMDVNRIIKDSILIREQKRQTKLRSFL